MQGAKNSRTLRVGLDVVGGVNELFQALDARFQNLFSTLQELNQAAQRFKTDATATSSKQATKDTAKDTIKKADATRTAAEKI